MATHKNHKNKSQKFPFQKEISRTKNLCKNLVKKKFHYAQNRMQIVHVKKS